MASLDFQFTDIIRQDLRSTRLDDHGILDANPPGAGVEAAVPDGDDHIGRQRRRRLFAVEEGVAGRQGRLLELDADAVHRRTEEVIALSSFFYDFVEYLVELDHADAGLHLGDRRLLGLQVEVIGSLLLRGRFSDADRPADVGAVPVA